MPARMSGLAQKYTPTYSTYTRVGSQIMTKPVDRIETPDKTCGQEGPGIVHTCFLGNAKEGLGYTMFFSAW
jgi:hypothetical protein